MSRLRISSTANNGITAKQGSEKEQRLGITRNNNRMDTRYANSENQSKLKKQTETNVVMETTNIQNKKPQKQQRHQKINVYEGVHGQRSATLTV